MDNAKFSGVLLRFSGHIVTIMTTISFLVCIAAIPEAIHYIKTEKGYVSEAEMSMALTSDYCEQKEVKKRIIMKQL